MKDAADFLILDDVKTVFDPKASFLDKGVALFSVTPTGKALKAGKLGFKLVQKSPFGKVISKKVDQVTSKGTGNPAHSATQFDKLKTHYQQVDKYGKAGVRDLSDGRIRYYGEVTTASKAGEMAGRRVVREWNTSTGLKRTWHETVDHNGMIRQVRPDVKFTGGSKM